jgi:predicted Zn-dependent peptidase
MPNVELTCVTTDKFKTGYFSVNLLNQLSGSDASKNALIPSVLRRGCMKYPDMESLALALNELYGAAVEPIVRTRGEIQCTGFVSAFADDKYLPGESNLLERVIGLTGEILLAPVTRGGLLQVEYVNSERENLCDQIRSSLNEKRAYSLRRLKELMCADEAFGVDRLGTVAAAEKITPIMLTKHYKKTLESAEIQMFYCGSADMSRVEAAVQSAFNILPRGAVDTGIGTQIRLDCGEAKYHTESLDVTQGKLALGFRLGETMYAPDYAAITVFNALYGGSVTSKLFLNVREKLSLCYYASSSIEKHKGVMLVSSGIEFDKYQQALDEILAQLEALKKGDITPQELDGAKKYVITSLKASLDSASDMDNFYLGQAVEGLNFGLEEFAAYVERVTAEDAIAVAKSVCLDTVYFLNGMRQEAIK